MRAWHFLADTSKDSSKVWSIEKDDNLQVLVYEFVDRYPGSAGDSVVYPTLQKDSIKWAVAEIKIKGATTLAASVAALIGSLLLF